MSLAHQNHDSDCAANRSTKGFFLRDPNIGTRCSSHACSRTYILGSILYSLFSVCTAESTIRRCARSRPIAMGARERNTGSHINDPLLGCCYHQFVAQRPASLAPRKTPFRQAAKPCLRSHGQHFHPRKCIHARVRTHTYIAVMCAR